MVWSPRVTDPVSSLSWALRPVSRRSQSSTLSGQPSLGAALTLQLSDSLLLILHCHYWVWHLWHCHTVTMAQVRVRMSWRHWRAHGCLWPLPGRAPETRRERERERERGALALRGKHMATTITTFTHLYKFTFVFLLLSSQNHFNPSSSLYTTILPPARGGAVVGCSTLRGGIVHQELSVILSLTPLKVLEELGQLSHQIQKYPGCGNLWTF